MELDGTFEEDLWCVKGDIKSLAWPEIMCGFGMEKDSQGDTGYRKSLNTSRASNTSWGFDLIVLIEARPRIEAGP